MSTYDSWNEFFHRERDNSVMQSARRNPLSDVDDLEDLYRKKYGICLDHHALKLTKLYGSENAWEIIGLNISALDADKRHAAELERMQYTFHAVPDNVEIPF
ncbi:MAG: hypothetical protein K2N98_00725 [Lachnospiraceae bacterium]|nr:hypothetical protein [Lachnospiraceae bacterium]